MTGLPTWTQEATEPTFSERRRLLQPAARGLMPRLAEATAPDPTALRRLLEGLEAEGPWVGATPGPEARRARVERDRQVARSQRARRLAGALVMVGALAAIASALSRDSVAFSPGERTRLDLRTLHRTGEGVAVIGQGEMTLESGGPQPTRLILHEGRVEVVADSEQPVRVELGPHTVELRSGTVSMRRQSGQVEIRVDEGEAFIFGPEGERVLGPEDPPWTGAPPEAVETCGAEAQGADPVGGSPQPATPTAAERERPQVAALALRLGPSPAALGMGGSVRLSSLEAAAASRALQQAKEGAAGQASGRPPRLRLVPGAGGPAAAPPSPTRPEAHGPRQGASTAAAEAVVSPAHAQASPGSTFASVAPGGAQGEAGHIRHTVDLGPAGAGPAAHSRMGVCPLPVAPPPPMLILRDPAPPAPPEPVATTRRAPPLPSEAPPPEAPEPVALGGRRIPELPGGAPADSARPLEPGAVDALDRLRFGPAVPFPECAPEGP